MPTGPDGTSISIGNKNEMLQKKHNSVHSFHRLISHIHQIKLFGNFKQQPLKLK